MQPYQRAARNAKIRAAVDAGRNLAAVAADFNLSMRQVCNITGRTGHAGKQGIQMILARIRRALRNFVPH